MITKIPRMITTWVFVLAMVFSANQSAVAQTPAPPTTEPTVEFTPADLEFVESEKTPVPNYFPPFFDTPLALSMHDHFYLSRPIEMDEVKWPTFDFRYGYFDKKTNSLHTGIDIVAALDTPVLAAGDGEVVFSGSGLLNGNGHGEDPYGIAVVIKHSFSFEGNSIYTVYGHFSKSLVITGQKVKSGETIGCVGLTGNTSGPHLHFEVRVMKEGIPQIQNPELWLVPPLDHGVLAGVVRTNAGDLWNSKEITLKFLENERIWKIFTYSSRLSERHLYDLYYRENFVLSDLPQGFYEISTVYNYKTYKTKIYIASGAINFVHFNGSKGFSQDNPEKSQSSDFLQ